MSFQRGDKNSTTNWGRDFSGYIAANSPSVFFPCLKNLYKTKFQGGRLIFLVEEVLRHENIQP